MKDAVHLQLNVRRDVSVYKKKRRAVYILNTDIGGSMLGFVPSVLCGRIRATLVVSWKERERVTCPRCRSIFTARFPADQASPRSGMRMPTERHGAMIRAAEGRG